MPLKIVVCIKQVSDPEHFSEITLNPETGVIQREKVPAILNPLDENALEEALRIRERFSGRVTVVSMGPPQAREVLEWALTLGADDAVLLCDRAFAGGDTLATAFTLAKAIQKLGQPDLILCGNQTADGATGQVGPQLAELLGVPHATYVSEVKFTNERTLVVKRVIEYGYLKVEFKLPALLSVRKDINQPRGPTAEGILREKEVKTWQAADIGVKKDVVGLDGSPTRVVGTFKQELKRQREILEGSAQEIAAEVVKKLRWEGIL